MDGRQLDCSELDLLYYSLSPLNPLSLSLSLRIESIRHAPTVSLASRPCRQLVPPPSQSDHWPSEPCFCLLIVYVITTGGWPPCSASLYVGGRLSCRSSPVDAKLLCVVLSIVWVPTYVVRIRQWCAPLTCSRAIRGGYIFIDWLIDWLIECHAGRCCHLTDQVDAVSCVTRLSCSASATYSNSWS